MHSARALYLAEQITSIGASMQILIYNHHQCLPSDSSDEGSQNYLCLLFSFQHILPSPCNFPSARVHLSMCFHQDLCSSYLLGFCHTVIAAGPKATSFAGYCSPTRLTLGDLRFIGIQSVSEMGLLQLPGPRWAGGEMTGWKWVVKTTTAKRLMQLIFHYVQCLWIVISLDCSSSEAQIKCKWFLNERKCSLWGTVLFRAAKWLEINGDYEECFMNPPRRT